MTNDTTKKEYTPILPFDISYGHNLDTYDHMPYVRDPKLCNADTVAMESGNVYKFYRCNEKKAQLIGGDPPVKYNIIEEEEEA